jgi:hypothetical protein
MIPYYHLGPSISGSIPEYRFPLANRFQLPSEMAHNFAIHHLSQPIVKATAGQPDIISNFCVVKSYARF